MSQTCTAAAGKNLSQPSGNACYKIATAWQGLFLVKEKLSTKTSKG